MSLVYILREASERLPDSQGIRSNYYKIGKGQGDVEGRIAQLQTGNPRPIEAVTVFTMPDAASAFYLETVLHNLHADHRIPGSEWFTFDEVSLQRVLLEAGTLQGKCQRLVEDEERFRAIPVAREDRAPDAEESARYERVKSEILDPRARDKRTRAGLDRVRKLFAFRKVLTRAPSISETRLLEPSQRFNLDEFREHHGALVEQFIRPGARSFRWSFRARVEPMPDDGLLDRAELAVRAVLQGGDAAEHRDLAEQVHESLRGIDEQGTMAQLRQLTALDAGRKVPERMERTWFSLRMADAAGITGICTCKVAAPRVDRAALCAHLEENEPALLASFMQGGQRSLRVSSPDGGVELDDADDS
jgi:hypothetical protein